MTTMQASTTTIPKQRKKSVFKKVINYLQDQAQQQSTSRDYLTPQSREPHQRRTHQESKNADGSHTLSLSRDTLQDTDIYPRQFSSMSTKSSFVSRNIKRIQYAHENLLQSYEVIIPEHASTHTNTDKYWVLFIHGGYFRDPKVDATAFRPALELLMETSPAIVEESDTDLANTESKETEFFSIQHNIAGYASINYRLSPHPRYPQDPEDTLKYELRNAKWPEHIEDVQAALRHLQSKYNFGSKYIIAGHSVGAALAFLMALKAKDAGLPPPTCVIGCNGIYDFPSIHITNPDYESVTSNAMDPKYYHEASPALYSVDDFQQLAKQGTTKFVLSHSKTDGLVVWDQVEIMKRVLDSAAASNGISVQLIETTGAHDVTWQEGRELARVIKAGINLITK